MSLILEALKKSEAKRRLGEAPDLDTPFAAKLRRRSPLPFIAAAIVVAGAGGWWLLPAPTAEKTKAVTPAQSQTANAKPMTDRIMAPAVSHPPPKPATAPVTSNVAADQAANSQIVARPAPRPIVLKTFGAAANTSARTADAAAAPIVTLKTPAPPTPTTELKAPDEPIQAVGMKKSEANVVVAPVPEVKAAPPVSKAPNVADANNATNAKKAAAPAPPVPASADAQPYYELPFSVRKDLPALKLSMHVYASEPAQRFIILNDSRMGEGDSQDELALRQILPDGAVFEFHGKRFFFPRDGL